jgi:hypothetical protein
MSDESRLAAMIDGVTLALEPARELWKEFSAHMDAHEGDMAGFAKLKGWFAVAPEYRQGKAVLLVRTTAAAPMPPAPKAKPPVPKAKPKAAGKPSAKATGKGKPGPAGKPNAKAAPAKKGAAKPTR